MSDGFVTVRREDLEQLVRHYNSDHLSGGDQAPESEIQEHLAELTDGVPVLPFTEAQLREVLAELRLYDSAHDIYSHLYFIAKGIA